MYKNPICGYIGKAKINTYVLSMFLSKKGNCQFQYFSVSDDSLSDFFSKRNFDFLCVYSPFKEKVICCLDNISESVKNTNCCNYVINKHGKLFGYNTEAVSFKNVIQKYNIKLSGKSVLILGNGPTARSIKYNLKTLGINDVILSGRTLKNSDELEFKKIKNSNAEILINTTPTGRDIKDKKLVQISNLKKLETAIDMCEEPYRSLYLIEAKQRGKGTVCGFEFAAENIKIACTLFNKMCFPNAYWKRARHIALLKTVNLVFVGIDHEYKREICEKIKQKSATCFIDVREIVEKETKKSFDNYHKENKLMQYLFFEEQVIEAIKNIHGKIINTSDQTLLVPQNILTLSRNGVVIYFKTTKFEGIFSKNTKKPLVSADEQEMNYYLLNDEYEKQADLTTSEELSLDEKMLKIFKAIIGDK